MAGDTLLLQHFGVANEAVDSYATSVYYNGVTVIFTVVVTIMLMVNVLKIKSIQMIVITHK